MIYRNTDFTFIFNPHDALKNNDRNRGISFNEAVGHISIHEFIKAYDLWKKVHFIKCFNLDIINKKINHFHCCLIIHPLIYMSEYKDKITTHVSEEWTKVSKTSDDIYYPIKLPGHGKNIRPFAILFLLMTFSCCFFLYRKTHLRIQA